MSLIDTSILQPPAAPASVDPDQAKLQRMLAMLQSNLAADVTLFYQLSSLIWSNANGKTPQQMFGFVGTAGASLLALSNAWIAFMTALNGGMPPTSLPPAGWTLTVNGDGSVTPAQS